MDNEASLELKKILKRDHMKYQLVPPHNHRTNLKERDICNFKNHFVTGLASVDPDFPVREWDRLIPQVEKILKFLRAARENPKLSAYTYIFGQFDQNVTPLVSSGTIVLSHDKSVQRSTWVPHGE